MITQIAKESVKRLQRALAAAGRYDGRIDGDLGPKTLQAMASYVTEGTAPADVGPLLDKWLPLAEITTRERLIDFFAHVALESGFEPRRENMNYSAGSLVSKFGRHRISTADADKYGRTSKQPADQKAIANILYGGPWGLENLGNTKPGDGWLFRGGGGIQSTGRAAARAVGTIIGLDLEGHPELFSQPEGSIASAVGVWKWKGMNEFSDANDFLGGTERLNGGLNGLRERRAFRTLLQTAWPS